jgi:hypothetical protein
MYRLPASLRHRKDVSEARALKQTPPLLDGGGAHFIQPGAFLTPLSLGLHTITAKWQIDGAGVLPATELVAYRKSLRISWR